MQTSEQIDKLTEALAKAQGMIETVKKNREVTVVSQRTGGKYTFKYATLDAIREAIRKPLSDNGIALIQTVDDETGANGLLTTTLAHASGQWIRSSLKLIWDGSGNQARGSAISYGRRYAIASMMGIVSEEDDDANVADSNEVEDKKRKKLPNMMDEAKAINAEQNAQRKANGQPPLRKPKPTRAEWTEYAIEDLKELNTVETIWAWWNDPKNNPLLLKLDEENHSLFEKVEQARDDRLDYLRANL